MNEKIHVILLKLVIELRHLGWKVYPDWEINLKSDGVVLLTKFISVTSSLNDNEISEKIETSIEVSLESDDQITFYPKYLISGEIFIDGGDIHDVSDANDCEIAFTEHDISDHKKIALAAKRISDITNSTMENQFHDYVDKNYQGISGDYPDVDLYDNPND